ncbi:MAG: hypothetical protein ACOYM4_08490 [Nodosilinea sp.]
MTVANISQIPLWLDILLRLIPALITLIVGVFGSYIAFNQYRTNRDKLRLDLFEKRLEAYEKLQEYFSYLIREPRVKDEAMEILYEARYRSLFLFDEEIACHIDQVLEKAKEMREIHSKLFGQNSLPQGEERTRLVYRNRDLKEWHDKEREDSPRRYARYLKFN